MDIHNYTEDKHGVNSAAAPNNKHAEVLKDILSRDKKNSLERGHSQGNVKDLINLGWRDQNLFSASAKKSQLWDLFRR